MSFYVEIRNGKIIAKLEAEYVPNDAREYKKISRELYESIGLTPCSFKEVDGEIVDVEHIPLPPPPPPEPSETELLAEYLLDVDFRVAMLELGLI